MAIDNQPYHASFRSYLQERERCSAERADEVLRIAEDVLPDFLARHFGEQLASLFDLQDREKARDLQGAIKLNPIIKAEDKSFGDVACSDVLLYYRHFLKSPYNPLHEGYTPPTPVPAELAGTTGEASPTQEPVKLKEGTIVQESHLTTHERNPELRRKCIEHFAAMNDGRIVCQCCGFDFSRAYRGIGEGYIEVHHRRPISQSDGEHEVDPATDLVPLCSNCHSMIHRVEGQGECMSLDQLKEKYIGKIYT